MIESGAPQRTGSFLATAAVFLVGLPLVATVIGAVLWHFGIGRGTGTIGPHDTLSAFAWYALISVFIGWPAMIAMAIGMPILSPRLSGRVAWLAAGAIGSAVLTGLSGLIIGGGGDLTEFLSFAWVVLLVGAVAGLLCALVSDRFRPRRIP